MDRFDWKNKMKKEYLNVELQANGTGGGPSSPLTALEERVVAFIGVPALVGQSGIKEHGFNRTSRDHVLEAENAMELPLEHENEGDIVLEDQCQDINSPLSPAIFGVPTVPEPQHFLPEAVLATPASSPLPPPPPPRTRLRQASGSPRLTPARPRRVLLRARRNRVPTSFGRAAHRFAAVEQRRLEYEEGRDKRLREREMERLRLEAQRIEVTREHNSLLHQLNLLCQQLIDVAATRQFTIN